MQELINMIQKDVTLTHGEKEYIIEQLSEPTTAQKLLYGAGGAGAGYVVGKFLKLPPVAQILLTISGFGIGKYLLDKSQKYDRFIQYNDRLKTYEINA